MSKIADWTKDALDWGVSNEDLNWRPSLLGEDGLPVVVAVASGRHAEKINALLADYWRSVKQEAPQVLAPAPDAAELATP